MYAEGNTEGSEIASFHPALRSQRPQTRLETSCTRTGDLGDAWSSSSNRPAGEGHKPQDSHARLRGVGQRCSTSERLEQRWETIGGERGGKTADQGEHQAVAHAPDKRGRSVSQRLSGVRKAAKERKKEKFTALLHHCGQSCNRSSSNCIVVGMSRQRKPGNGSSRSCKTTSTIMPYRGTVTASRGFARG